jgi:hypothetical protein
LQFQLDTTASASRIHLFASNTLKTTFAPLVRNAAELRPMERLPPDSA